MYEVSIRDFPNPVDLPISQLNAATMPESQGTNGSLLAHSDLWLSPRIGAFHLESHLPLLDPRQQSSQRNHRSNDDCPKLDVEDILVVIRLGRRAHGGQTQRKDDISSPPMILVDSFRFLDAAKEPGGKKLQRADDRLKDHEDVGGEAHNCMRRLEMRSVTFELVDLDHYECSDEGCNGYILYNRVDVGSQPLLLLSVGRLEYQDALGEQQECRGVQQLLIISFKPSKARLRHSPDAERRT